MPNSRAPPAGSTEAAAAGNSVLSVVRPDGVDLSRSFAQLSLPSPLRLAPAPAAAAAAEGEAAAASAAGGGGLCVVARQAVAARTQFGPLQGEDMLERDVPEDFDMKDLWQVRQRGASPRC